MGEFSRVSVSGVRNQTHAVYVTSWIRHQLSNPERTVSVVDLDGGYREFESPAILEDLERVEVVDVHDGRDGPLWYVAIGSPGVKPYLGLRRSGERKIHAVVVDEGLGTYGSWSTRRAGLRREGASPASALIRSTTSRSFDRLVDPERWTLFAKTADEWHVTSEIADEFRLRSQPVTPTGRIVYLSQPWPELGVVRAAQYSEHLHRVAAEVKSAGREFSVRPHPWERRPDAHGLPLLRGTGPAELDSEVLSAALVLGETSTALLTVSAIFGTPTCRVVGPADDVAGLRLARDQEQLFRTFTLGPVSVDDLAGRLR